MSSTPETARTLDRNLALISLRISSICTACALSIIIWSVAQWPVLFKLIAMIGVAAITYVLFFIPRTIFIRMVGVLPRKATVDVLAAQDSICAEINNLLDIEKIANVILSKVTEIIRVNRASLLVMGGDQYACDYAQTDFLNTLKINLVLKKESSLVAWLDKNAGLITIEAIGRDGEISAAEVEGLESAGVSLLCPVKTQERLVAVLALSEMQDNKKFTPSERGFLMHLCRSAATVVENALMYKQAKQQANTDELTGIYNQNYFHQRIEQEIARSTRFGEIFTVLFLDVDNFKQFNDASGHLAGDQILKNIGQFIRNNLRESDLCFRYGGDEFAVVLPKTPLDGSRIVAQRILDGVPKLNAASGLPLTVSLGIASWPTDGVLKHDIIHSADAALYHSKHKGKNCISIACEVALSEVFRIETFVNQNEKDMAALLKTIYALAATVDAKDPYARDHSKNVTRYATEIARALRFSDEGVERIRVAASLHDIGKIGIPDHILHKVGLLTRDEREIMQAHPNLGVAIIQHVETLRECMAAIQYHHENYNGTGYPSGLKGDNIPLDARILGVADAFDAMTSPRSYRRTFSYEEALDELKSCSGTQFDPEIVQAFLKLKVRQKVPRPVSKEH